MALESSLRARLEKKDILLMTHIVLGYPSFEDSFHIIETMVEAGVDLMELQVPFSEPIADGPVILRANQRALEGGASVQECLELAEKASTTFDIPFLIMTYYNIVFQYGTEKFPSTMAKAGLKGAIIPDLPPEESHSYLKAMGSEGLDPILIFSPTTPLDRMKYLARFAGGFVYCVARKGVTGQATDFSDDLSRYLARCRTATSLPLAVGFGIKEKTDIDFLKGKADIAVIGTQTIRMMEEKGVESIGVFIRSLL
ncbi:MAG: tryptophan synthase subunit alpha [Desulfatiglans sp.]|jgi:tryptophan synthase alpha chain|nr:tryptophan synthase subunit alpha [Thermodesulfobacteriota bacterium]MEE4351903.1 tryptophan synthase subunit alpha [Desulfatiglans sp.]